MLLWTPEGSEGQSLHLWLAASCHSAQSGGAGKKVFRDSSQNFPIISHPKKRKKAEHNNSGTEEGVMKLRGDKRVRVRKEGNNRGEVLG